MYVKPHNQALVLTLRRQSFLNIDQPILNLVASASPCQTQMQPMCPIQSSLLGCSKEFWLPHEAMMRRKALPNDWSDNPHLMKSWWSILFQIVSLVLAISFMPWASRSSSIIKVFRCFFLRLVGPRNLSHFVNPIC